MTSPPAPIVVVMTELPNHRLATDAEYNVGKTCWNCGHYSFKSYSSDDENSGKCFALCSKGVRNIQYTEGKKVCDLFVSDCN